ncbi:MAG: hypothetical protein SF052_21100 [Bacteroidia bacterium]|nr:hypothetical protein [Bacteroidia bacterium]
MEANPEEFQPEKGKHRLPVFRIMAILTVLAFLIVLPLFYYLSTSASGSPEKLFTAIHAEDIPADGGIAIEQEVDLASGFTAAMTLFSEENYEEALVAFTDLIKTGPENDTLACYIGLTHLELKHSDTAIFWLEKALSVAQPGIISEKAQIYLGLAYTLKGDFPKAKEIFNLIAGNENHTYHNEAIKAEARLLRYIEREEE